MVWQLYHQTRSYLNDSAGYRAERAKRREELHREVAESLPESYAEEIEAHFDGMPERYFQSRGTEEIGEHLRLFRKFFEQSLREEGSNLDPVITWVDHPEAGHAEVMVCGWDRERLLERIAAAFLAAGINVLGADVYTRADSLALDIFKVSNHRNDPLPKQRDREQFEAHLQELLPAPGSRIVPEPQYPSLKRRAKAVEDEGEEPPVWVVVNNNAHPACTILEVQAPGRLGLLYHLLRAITHGGISIEAARIATEQKAALDVFYLRTKEGGKITARNALLRLERRLRTASERAESPR
jgi:[protein-PII] uridylyltransferase